MIDGFWFEPVRAYCERTGPGFWGEPFNALSNGAFLLAAAAGALRAGRRDPAALALAGLVAVVGTGSFLFHTLANRWSMLADVIPIGVFIYGYFLLALVRFLARRFRTAALITLLFAGFSFGLSPALDAVTGRSAAVLSNGSIDYLPAALALIGVGIAQLVMPGGGVVRPPRRRAGLALLGVTVLFLVSLAFRTLDRAVCPQVPIGTHLLWHVLNAGVLYALVATAIRFREQTMPVRPSAA